MTDRQTILVLVPDGLDGRGGIERLMLYLTRAMPKADPDIELVTHRTRLVRIAGLRHASTLLSLLWFALRCASGGVHTIHANIAPRGSTWRKAAFVVIARAFGLPVVLHLHGSGYDAYWSGRSRPQQRAIARFFRHAERVVVLGRHWARFAQDTLGCDPRRIAVVPNGAPDAATRADPGRTPCRIAFAGRIGKRKGVDCLIAALSALPPDRNWHLGLCGDGAVSAHDRLARTAGLSDRVRFHGWLDEAALDRLLGEAQLFVLPSRAENQPVAILEAMARGLPVIATRIAAIPDLVDDGVTGLLVPPDDPVALATALDRLITDPAARSRMGQAGRARFERHFTLTATARSLAQVHRNAVAAGPRLSRQRDAPPSPLPPARR